VDREVCKIRKKTSAVEGHDLEGACVIKVDGYMARIKGKLKQLFLLIRSRKLLHILIWVEERWIPRKLFYYHKMYTIVFSGTANRFQKPINIVIRQASPNDLSKMLQCYDKKSEFIDRFSKGDLCFVGEYKGDIVSMVWICFKEYYVERDDFLFLLGEDGAFIYDGFTHPAHRMRGMHVYLLNDVIEFLSRKGESKIYGHIDHENDLSMQTHIRFGFRVLEEISFLNFLGLRLHVIKNRQLNSKRYIYTFLGRRFSSRDRTTS